MASADDLSAVFKKSCNIGATKTQGEKTTMTTANLTKWFKVSIYALKAWECQTFTKEKNLGTFLDPLF